MTIEEELKLAYETGREEGDTRHEALRNALDQIKGGEGV